MLEYVLRYLLKKAKLRFVCKNQSNNHMCLNIIMQEKKSSFIIKYSGYINRRRIVKNNVADIGMNFYEKSKFENNSIYKFINVGDWIFSDMK